MSVGPWTRVEGDRRWGLSSVDESEGSRRRPPVSNILPSLEGSDPANHEEDYSEVSLDFRGTCLTHESTVLPDDAPSVDVQVPSPPPRWSRVGPPMTGRDGLDREGTVS